MSKLNFVGLVGFVSISVMSGTAFAGEVKCSDALSTASYASSSPDGGANRGPQINWIIDGVHFTEETDIEIVNPGGGFSRPDLRDISSEFSEQNMLSEETKNDIRTRVFSSFVKVSTYPAKVSKFEGYVICTESKYVGYPRP